MYDGTVARRPVDGVVVSDSSQSERRYATGGHDPQLQPNISEAGGHGDAAEELPKATVTETDNSCKFIVGSLAACALLVTGIVLLVVLLPGGECADDSDCDDGTSYAARGFRRL